jgi:hypothetical protein
LPRNGRVTLVALSPAKAGAVRKTERPVGCSSAKTPKVSLEAQQPKPGPGSKEQISQTRLRARIKRDDFGDFMDSFLAYNV